MDFTFAGDSTITRFFAKTVSPAWFKKICSGFHRYKSKLYNKKNQDSSMNTLRGVVKESCFAGFPACGGVAVSDIFRSAAVRSRPVGLFM